MQIEVTRKPSEAQLWLHQREFIKHVNTLRDLTPLATIEHLATQSFSVLVSDEGAQLAGAVANITMAHLFIEILWVDAKRRRGGLGCTLVVELEKLARAENCLRMVTSTFQFHGALSFWRKVGFDTMAELPGRTEAEALFYLKKDL